MELLSTDILDSVMLINTDQQCFNMQAIENRRFMYQPQTKTLILGAQYQDGILAASHGDEHAASGATEPFDSFIRGWVGTGKTYPDGVIHFTPCIESNCTTLFDKAFDVLLMFLKNRANGRTVVRGFWEPWEQPLADILPTAVS